MANQQLHIKTMQIFLVQLKIKCACMHYVVYGYVKFQY